MDLKISDMIAMQLALWEKHKHEWSPMDAEHARSFMLFMFEEIGEAIAIIKKKGEAQIMNDGKVREEFVTELADVMMYYINTVQCFGISADEFSEAYVKKHDKNMGRDYAKENREFLASDI